MNNTSEWVEAPDYPGYIMKELKFGDCTIYVYRPELEQKEKAKREAHLKAVAESVLSSYYKRKGEL